MYKLVEGLLDVSPIKPRADARFDYRYFLTGHSDHCIRFVGVGLAFVDVNIFVAAASIGLATTVMVTLGVLLSRAIRTMAGKRAEVVGGIVLMLVGATILYEHLSVIA